MYMDDDKFKQLLSEIADWYIPIQSETADRLRKPMPASEINRSLGPVIETLHPQANPCTLCGVATVSRWRHTKKVNSAGRKICWLHECGTCGRGIDPSTGDLVPKTRLRVPARALTGVDWWNYRHGSRNNK